MATAVNDSYTYAYNTPQSVSAPGILANDTTDGWFPMQSGSPTGGSVSAFWLDGSFTWSPSSGATVGQFYYYLTDMLGGSSNVATVTMTATGVPAQTSTGNVSLFANGFAASSGGLTLCSLGHAAPTPLSATLFASGAPVPTGAATLASWGYDATSSQGPLFAAGSVRESGHSPLVSAGYAVLPKSLVLSAAVDPVPVASTSLPLFANGSAFDGQFRAADLFASGDGYSNIPTRSMVLSAHGVSGPLGRGMALWGGGEAHVAIGSTDLVAWNSQVGAVGATTLFAAGSGTTDGYVPVARGMNLVLLRDPTAAAPLFLQGEGVPVTGGATLYAFGAYLAGTGTTLAAPAAVGFQSRTTKLYANGW